MGFDRNTQNKEYESGNAIGSILCISELYQHKGPPMQIVKEGVDPRRKIILVRRLQSSGTVGGEETVTVETINRFRFFWEN